jgi:hypothetical protein
MLSLVRFLGWYPAPAKHIEERLKLGAGGIQLVAIALIGSAFIAPLFNPSLHATGWRPAAAAAVAALLEGAALKLLGYIPVAIEPITAKEPNNG